MLTIQANDIISGDVVRVGGEWVTIIECHACEALTVTYRAELENGSRGLVYMARADVLELAGY